MEILAALSLLALALGYWLSAMRAREQAGLAARGACQRIDAQFLDESVACIAIKLIMYRGKPAWHRSYAFEYAHDDASRHPGRLVLIGRELTGIFLEGSQILH
jgi:hypothetical protein